MIILRNVGKFPGLMTLLLFFGGSLTMAQTRPGPTIVIVEGEGSINNLQIGSALEPEVEIRDENGRPVAGALVTFSVPEGGASGSFFGAGSKLTVSTDDRGRARGTRFRPNTTEGRFQIRVTAAFRDGVSTTNINQTNVRTAEGLDRVRQPERKFGKKKILAILAAGTIAGAIVAAHGGDEDTVSIPGTTVTPGTVTVGIPK